MESYFQYSNDFYGIIARELSRTCMHLLCTAGEGCFVFNERCYHIVKNDLVVIPAPSTSASRPAITAKAFSLGLFRFS